MGGENKDEEKKEKEKGTPGGQAGYASHGHCQLAYRSSQPHHSPSPLGGT